uniref:Uncharacterized protein n=1 Tax=Aegilops tauschii subsp. strangulata TaxID=200361 RepID=A0A453SIS3_AEGTS
GPGQEDALRHRLLLWLRPCRARHLRPGKQAHPRAQLAAIFSVFIGLSEHGLTFDG